MSGTTEEIERIEQDLEKEGYFAQRLNVATAFHSKVVSSSVHPFASFLEKIALALAIRFSC